MSTPKKKELIIIGAGPGGYAAAFRAADLGLKVTLIDPEANPGGVCLYRGCIPSKALLHIVKTKQEAEEAADRGVAFDKPKIDVDKMRSWKEGVVKKLTSGTGQLAKVRQIEYIRGMAHFESENRITVKPKEGDSYSLAFENLILATGSVPVSLPGIKIDHDFILDSADALDIKEIPESMLVIGGGYIGLEMGTVYAGLGCRLSIAEMTSGFLPGADRDLVNVFQKEHPFTEVYFETKVTAAKIEKDKVKVTLETKDGKTRDEEFGKVLVAVGRKPNTETLDLANAGIQTGEKGFIKVDLTRRTKEKAIYAIGDITGEPMLAHKASHEGIVAAEAIAGKAGAAFDPRSIPAIVFTHPEIAWCGLTEDRAQTDEIAVRILTFRWSASGSAIALGTTNGITKLITDRDTGRILGGGVAGKNAGSLIPEISLAIEMGTTAEDLALSIHPHPTLSETIMEAAEFYGGKATHSLKQ